MTETCNCNNCRNELCIRKVPIFSTLNQEDVGKIASLINHRDYKKGETILFDGDYTDSVVIINEGSAKAYKNTPDGREQILYVFSEGDFFGEQNLLGNKTATFSVEALQPVNTCILSRGQFQKLLYSYPEIAVKIIEELSGRMARLETALQSMGVRNVDTRVGGILLEFATKYSTKTNEGTLIHLPLSREGIANYLGVARETLSRKLGQLENEGLIRSVNNKEILIPNMQAIELLAGAGY